MDTNRIVADVGQNASRAGDIFRLYLDDISDTTLLSRDEECDLAYRIQAGDQTAREHMIKANLRLVVRIARSYENYGLPLLDLISEGNIGLMKAVDRYDPGRGVKFSTYAAWWIKQSICRALANQSKTIRLPIHFVAKLSNLRRAHTRLHEQLEREPTDEELAVEVGIETHCVASWRNAAAQPVSMDACLGDDDGTTFGEVIADENAEAPSDYVEEQFSRTTVLRLLSQLPERSAQVLRWRFGFDGDDQPTLEEIALKLGVSRERIRQIELSALTKLRKIILKERKMQLAA